MQARCIGPYIIIIMRDGQGCMTGIDVDEGKSGDTDKSLSVAVRSLHAW